MKRPLRTAGLAALVLLAAIQFIRPARNRGAAAGPQDVAARVAVPADVGRLLVDACYNCHSDRTAYPWYADVQPAGWWLAHHVNEGKAHLNFSRFAAYPPKRAGRKLDGVAELVDKQDMPLVSYTWLHPEARLTAEQRARIVVWAQTARGRFPSP
jgi:hypothetical protein